MLHDNAIGCSSLHEFIICKHKLQAQYYKSINFLKRPPPFVEILRLALPPFTQSMSESGRLG